MARLPKDPSEAVAELGVKADATVMAIGPREGFAEALADAVGAAGRIIVRFPPPDLTQQKKAVEIVDELAPEATADPVIAWVPVIPVQEVRDLPVHVAEGGALWVVVPRGERDAPVVATEGDLKRILLPLGWRETRVTPIAVDQLAVRFHRRR